LGQGGWQVQAQHGQRLRHPLAQADRRAGVGLVQLAGQRLQLGLGVQGGVGVVRGPHPSLHLGPEPPRQLVFDVPQLVQLAPSEHGMVEDVQDRTTQCLGG